MIAQSQANSPFVVVPTGFEPVFESCRAFANIVCIFGRVQYMYKMAPLKRSAAQYIETLKLTGV